MAKVSKPFLPVAATAAVFFSFVSSVDNIQPDENICRTIYSILHFQIEWWFICAQYQFGCSAKRENEKPNINALILKFNWFVLLALIFHLKKKCMNQLNIIPTLKSDRLWKKHFGNVLYLNVVYCVVLRFGLTYTSKFCNPLHYYFECIFM